MESFDRIAPFYDALAGAVFGGALLRAQRWVVGHGVPPTAREILFLGGGSGRVLPEILARAPLARVTYVEPAPKMLRRARRHLLRHAPAADVARVDFCRGTDADIAPRAYDCVLTFFVLDVFAPTELPLVVARLSAVAAPGAAWLVADFAPPRTRWQRALLAVMYRFFRLTAGLRTQTLPDWPAALLAAGWYPHRTAHFVRGAVRGGTWHRTSGGPTAGVPAASDLRGAGSPAIVSLC